MVGVQQVGLLVLGQAQLLAVLGQDAGPETGFTFNAPGKAFQVVVRFTDKMESR